MELVNNLENETEKIKRGLRFGFKPTDCKYCCVASIGVAGAHYLCDCKESKMHYSYPLIMCPQDCKFYGKEENAAATK